MLMMAFLVTEEGAGRSQSANPTRVLTLSEVEESTITNYIFSQPSIHFIIPWIASLALTKAGLTNALFPIYPTKEKPVSGGTADGTASIKVAIGVFGRSSRGIKGDDTRPNRLTPNPDHEYDLEEHSNDGSIEGSPVDEVIYLTDDDSYGNEKFYPRRKSYLC